jgi:hypothetical protein
MSEQIMPPALAAEFHQRAMAVIGAFLRSDADGCAELVGQDAEELLPVVTEILISVIDRLGYREMVEYQLDEWFADRLAS